MTSLPVRTTLAAVAIAALGACATKDASQGWRIEPLMRVQHSAAASQAFYLTGRYYDGMRRWAQAADEYRKATVANPRNTDAFNALGVALARLGDHSGAEQRLREALALQPDRADIRSNLGLVLMHAHRPTEAVEQLRLALEADKDNTVAQDNLQRALAHGAAIIPSGGESAVSHAPHAALQSPQAPLTVPQPIATRAATPSETATPSAPLSAQWAESPTSLALQVTDRPSVAWQTSDTPRPEATLPAAPAPIGTGAAKVRLEISNGNGVPGAAARLRTWLAGQGVATQHLSNRKPYVQPATVIEYRAGHEAQAQALAQLLPTQPNTQPRTGLRADVRVLIGRDWHRIASCLEDDACAGSAIRLAHSGLAP